MLSAGCSFKGDFADQYQCSASDPCPADHACIAGACVQNDAGVDATRATSTWRSDLEADFGASGHALAGATIAPRGAIEPIAYYTGGVLERATPNPLADDSVTWDQVVAMPATAREAIARSTDVTWGLAMPPGVGLTAVDAWTVRFEGEVWLDAGAWTFFLLVDDLGFLDVADAAGVFSRIASATSPTEASGAVEVTTAGWYPLRWVASDTSGAASMRLRFQGPGVATPTAIPRHRLRVRADQLDGLVMTAFAGELMGGVLTTTLDATSPAAVDWARSVPGDLGLDRVDDFSVRWSGQMRVDVPGIYYLRYVSDDGQRLWVDDTKVLEAWDSTNHELVSPPLDLAAGWHGLVVDLSDHVRDASALLTVDRGPELTGQPLPADRLRPVEGRVDRVETGGNPADIVIPDAPSVGVDGIANSTFTLTAPPGAVVHGLELGLVYEHEYQGDLRIELIAPDGRIATLHNGTGTTGGTFARTYVRTDLDGAPVTGTWTLRVADVDPMGVGSLRDVQLTVHTAGAGEPPITTSASYESPPHDLGEPTTLDAVRWQAWQPTGTTVAVMVRTCAAAADCATQPWSAALSDPAGSVPAVPALRFAQYRVELTSTGDNVASLESIELDYQQ